MKSFIIVLWGKNKKILFFFFDEFLLLCLYNVLEWLIEFIFNLGLVEISFVFIRFGVIWYGIISVLIKFLLFVYFLDLL